MHRYVAAVLLPRRPSGGPPPETTIIDGEPCDIFAFPAPLRLPIAPVIFASAGSSATQSNTDYEHIDAVSGEVMNLRDWVRSMATVPYRYGTSDTTSFQSHGTRRRQHQGTYAVPQ